MTELGDSLERMNFMQLLLLFGFVTAYVVSVGGLFGATARLRAAVAALAQAAAFIAMTEPWVHGALLVAFVVAGLGLFVLVSWLLARWLGPRPLPRRVRAPADSGEVATPASQPLPPAAPKLVRRARATR